MISLQALADKTVMTSSELFSQTLESSEDILQLFQRLSRSPHSKLIGLDVLNQWSALSK